MKNAGYVALSRQMVLQRQMDAIANNIANMETPAYKAEELIFAEHLSRVGGGIGGGIGGRGTGGPKMGHPRHYLPGKACPDPLFGAFETGRRPTSL